jgi:acetylornithine deacetylase/succinyl-diaminopimelate desuccinylase-like protein
MELLEILNRLISINSVSGQEKKICLWISKFLKRKGFAVEMQEVENERWNILVRKGNPKILFFGHVDTVPPVEFWRKNPFKMDIEGDKAFGLGTWDMKGSLAAIMFNAQHAENMAILFTVDEEETSMGSWAVIEKKEFFRGIELIISGEAGNTPKTYGGFGHFTTGRHGVKDYEITKRLEAGHAATQDQEWVNWLCNSMKTFPEMKSKIVVRNFHATSKGFSIPEKAEMDLDVIIHPSEKDFDFDSFLVNHFKTRKDYVKRKTSYLSPYSFEGHPQILRIADLFEKRFGKKPEYYLGTSNGDENVLATLGIPILISGMEGRNEHDANEWVSIKCLKEVSSYYKMIIENDVPTTEAVLAPEQDKPENPAP